MGGRMHQQARLDIRPAAQGDLADIRLMLGEYAAGLGIDLSFQGFDREVRDLPGDYTPPSGALLIARTGERALGMVAMRRRGPARAEMKRLFVRPAARSAGLGRRLAEAIIEAARAAGYHEMVLDTLPTMADAQELYARLGFRDMPPYYESPIAGTRFMALAL
jgi:ribosomal protein S18 acetylase RimI-like enzyme